MATRRLPIDSSPSDHEDFLLPSSVEDHADSVKFFSCCMLASTSLIFNRRNLLTPEHFKKMVVCRIVTRILDPKEPIAGLVISNLDGVSQALEKGFLKEFAILICDDRKNADSPAEVYSWRFVYTPHGVPTANFVDAKGNCIASIAYKDLAHTKYQLTVLLIKLRNLCTKVLKPLVPRCFGGFRVAYTEKRPDDYCVPGFEPSELMYVLKDDVRPVPFRDGGMASPHHGMMLSVSSSFLPRCGDDTIYEKISSSKILDSKKSSNSSFDQSSNFGNVFSSANSSFVVPERAPATARRLQFTSSNDSIRGVEMETPRVAVRTSDVELPRQRQTKDLVDDRIPKAKKAASNTNTVTSAADVGDFLDESSLLLDRRTRSSMSTESTSSTSLASAGYTNPPRRKRTSVVVARVAKASQEKGDSQKSRRHASKNSKSSSNSSDSFKKSAVPVRKTRRVARVA